ncbi:hypothetical protein [Streptomyces cylindrosporus]|uniref:Peptidoglycan binding domain-containing protein n=1 Tax=Streptomyces cylindrosporus TaxID=2927583 RepID=A0ABS9Y7H6_9ACTN|nr:hypothetical protein [Streptomyces cylindrosporus]MCI3272894.1 hypothetical protein [Streptomyces cylindrosporus]
MSRETDTPSSGPNGHGGAAYPSGTPPYGTPTASDAGTDAGRSAAQPEERKTETTLTTRIRINIPGSRPIPPVVVRTPVAGTESPAEETGETELPAAGPATGTVEPPAEPGQPAEKQSDWFAPRKSGPAKGGQGGGATNGAGLPGGSGAGAGASAAGAAPGGARPGGGTGAPAAPRAGTGRPGGVVGSMSVPGGSRSGGARPGGTNGAGLPGGATGGPVAPGHGGGTGSFDVTEALAAGPLGGAGGSRPGGEPRRDDLPYFSENDRGGQDGLGGQNGQGSPNGQGGYGGPDTYAGPDTYGGPSGAHDFNGSDPYAGANDFNSPDGYGGQGGASGFNGPNGRGGQGGSQGPAGPTTGPVTGDGPMVPPIGAGPGGIGTGPSGIGAGPGGPSGPGAGPLGPGSGTGPQGPGSGLRGPGASPQGSGSGPLGPGAGRQALGAGPMGPGTGIGTGPQGPGTGINAGPQGPGASLGPGGGLSDDTAILTPQKPAPEPGTQGYPAPDNVSGHTVTSGIPVVPQGSNSPFGPGAFGQDTDAEAPGPHTPPKLPDAPSQNSSASTAPKKKKKGRNKLVLLGGLVVVAGVGAYGAGLLMNHSDVPKGTTVLGVDIGGGTRDDAVKKLDAAFGKSVNKPLKLKVGGSTVSLTPDQAGLHFDEQSTVSAAAKSDYNPISVIGSLFGQHRVVEPDMPVDEEKLTAALQSAAGGSGSMTEGTIEFKSGKAVAVYGKAGKGIDAAKSTEAVAQAYRTQVETGSTDPVAVATTTKQPTITNAEVDREMKAFAEPAMSGLVTVKTDTGISLPLSPQNSLWKFLRVEAVNGKLVDKPDLVALKKLYGGQFDGVLITRATGKKTAVTPQDVYVALRQALLSKTNRVGVIDTNPS